LTPEAIPSNQNAIELKRKRSKINEASQSASALSGLVAGSSLLQRLVNVTAIAPLARADGVLANTRFLQAAAEKDRGPDRHAATTAR
jgi:hypothetical protein